MNDHPIVLGEGLDLREAIGRRIRRKRILAGIVLAVEGELSLLNLRLPSTPEKPNVLNRGGGFTITLLSGLVSVGHTHLHMGVVDKQGNMHGGHLLEGNTTSSKVRLVIGELKDLAFTDEPDPETGYCELVVHKIVS